MIRAEVEVALADPDASRAELRQMGEVVLEAPTHALCRLADGARRASRCSAARAVDLAARPHRGRASASRGAARHIDVRLDLQPAPIERDPPLVERLVANLVENAVRRTSAAAACA